MAVRIVVPALICALALAEIGAGLAAGESPAGQPVVRVEAIAPAIAESSIAAPTPAEPVASGGQVILGTVAPVISLSVGADGRVEQDRSSVAASITRISGPGSDTVTAIPR